MVLRADAVFLSFVKAVFRRCAKQKSIYSIAFAKNRWFSGKAAVYAFCIGGFLFTPVIFNHFLGMIGGIMRELCGGASETAPHNTKCRCSERGAPNANPKAQIILCCINEHFGNAVGVPQPLQRRLSPPGGNCAAVPQIPATESMGIESRIPCASLCIPQLSPMHFISATLLAQAVKISTISFSS